MELVDQACQNGADEIIIVCFDDTALEEAGERVDCPIFGIGQAAYHYAALRYWQFSVVTTHSVSVPILEENPASASRYIMDKASGAEAEDAVSAISLSCAGIVGVNRHVKSMLSVETIDPVVCVARCMSWMT